MDAHREHESRRRFLQQVSAGAVALWTYSGSVNRKAGPIGLQDGSSCAPPKPAGAPIPFTRDCRPIRPRVSAGSLNASQIDQLRKAYQAMKALDTSDPSDPRGFVQQAKIHCWNCGEGT